MIVVTGGAGFIGYNLVKELIKLGYKDIVVVDNNPDRFLHRVWKDIKNFNDDSVDVMTVEDSFLWLGFNKHNIDVVYHLGARTDTAEKDEKIFEHLNLNYSKFIWNLCTEAKISLVYASSAATYGDGEDGFDDEGPILNLKPLNPYGDYKHYFDMHALGNSYGTNKPPFWAGLKFFNVYGNHEATKVRWHRLSGIFITK